MTSGEVPSRTLFWRTVAHFDAAKINPGLGLRNCIGVALPLAAGVLLHNTAAGLVAATGALNVAFSDGSGPYLPRARRMLYACGFVALAVFACRLCGQNPLLAVLLSASRAFPAGMMVALGPTPADPGTGT